MLITRQKALIVIAGPTAVGKTSLAISLAKKLKTEIISADSRQFFRELNIGTAKPSPDELAAVPHHFINSHSIHEEYDSAQFATDALLLLEKLFQKYDQVILVGGSGLYIKALVDGFDDIPQVPEEIREMLIREFEENGIEWLRKKMEEVDPEYLEKIDRQNPHRLIRALEVKLGTGQSLGSYHGKKKAKHDFAVIKIGLELPREELYQRIDSRMDDMIAQGLFQEAESLLPFRSHQALQTVGYTEIFDYLAGTYDKEEAIRLLKRNSRRYSKRQMTWFKRDGEFRWFGAGDVEEVWTYIQRTISNFQ